MRIMILGATGLTGSAMTTAALRRGHEVIAVHRGVSSRAGVELPDSDALKPVILDRLADGHDALKGETFDAVIDVSGYAPAVVTEALDALYDDDVQWVYISSVSVCADQATPMQGEDVRLREIEDAPLRAQAVEDPNFEWWAFGLYGECKVLCEREVEEATDEQATILRPTVIAGAHDKTWRFSYWVDRFARPGTIVMPTPPDAPIAVVDVEDLAEFAVKCCEERTAGTFVIGPDPSEATFGALAQACCNVLQRSSSDIAWVEPRELMAAGVEPWAGLPFWLPDDTAGMNAFDTSKARAAGFKSRPLVDTVAAVADWLGSAAEDELPDVAETMTPELEHHVLSASRA